MFRYDDSKFYSISSLFSPLKKQAGITAAPARAVSAVKEMNLPQKIKDMKLPELPSIGGLKF